MVRSWTERSSRYQEALLHVIAAKAVCFHLAMQSEFKEYAKQIVANARLWLRALASEASGSSREARITT